MGLPKFYLRTKGINCRVYYQISIGKEKDRGVTDTYVNEEFWDKKHKIALPVGEYEDKAVEINRQLKEFSKFCESLLNEKDKSVVHREVNRYLGRIKTFNRNKKGDIYSTINEMVKFKKGKISNETIEEYRTLSRLLRAFEHKENVVMEYDAFGEEFYDAFVDFLKEPYQYESKGSKFSKKGYSVNYTGKHIKNLKAVMKRALKKGYTTNMFGIDSDFKILKERSFAVYLTEEELEKFRSYRSDNETTMAVAFYFLLMCETALRVSDVLRLSKDNIRTVMGKGAIKFHESKTGEDRSFFINDRVQELLDRWDGQLPNDVLEKGITRRKMNYHIEKICRQPDMLSDMVRTVDGKDIEIVKWKYVHSHTGRRTYCTLERLKGKTLAEIRAQSFHTNDKTLRSYIMEADDNLKAEIALREKEGRLL